VVQETQAQRPEPLLITTEHYTLDVALLLVLAYPAWRHDRQDGPLALLRGYDLFVSLGIEGLRAIWFRYSRQDVLLRFGLGWPIDVLFVSFYAALWAVAFRYHHDRWPARMGSKAGVLALGLLAVLGVHVVQRLHFGLGPWDIGLRWVVLNLSCLISSVFAGWHLAQVFRLKQVYPAHLVLGFSIVISIIQFLMALRPGAWDMSLFRLANLVFLVVSLAAYGVRLTWFSFRPGRSGHRR